MRAHDQTDVRRRSLAGAWLLAFAVACVASARGEEAPVARWTGDPADSIHLAADRVQTWTDGGAEWLLLEDRAEVAQGDVSLQADRAVARIFRAGRVDGTIYRVEIYVEGNVRDPGNPGSAFPKVRTRLVTTAKVGFDARLPDGHQPLKKPPMALADPGSGSFPRPPRLRPRLPSTSRRAGPPGVPRRRRPPGRHPLLRIRRSSQPGRSRCRGRRRPGPGSPPLPSARLPPPMPGPRSDPLETPRSGRPRTAPRRPRASRRTSRRSPFRTRPRRPTCRRWRRTPCRSGHPTTRRWSTRRPSWCPCPTPLLARLIPGRGCKRRSRRGRSG